MIEVSLVGKCPFSDKRLFFATKGFFSSKFPTKKFCDKSFCDYLIWWQNDNKLLPIIFCDIIRWQIVTKLNCFSDKIIKENHPTKWHISVVKICHRISMSFWWQTIFQKKKKWRTTCSVSTGVPACPHAHGHSMGASHHARVACCGRGCQ